MKSRAALLVGVIALAAAPLASAQNGARFGTNLEGLQEVPVVSTAGSGVFDAVINRDETAIDYTFSYENIQGTVTQAHIHVGRRDTNGGISVWLCASNPPITTAPPGTPACGSPSASFTGTITAANVVGPTGQLIAPGEFAELVRMIRAGAAYANVHSTLVPSGEIRGQIEPGHSGH